MSQFFFSNSKFIWDRVVRIYILTSCPCISKKIHSKKLLRIKIFSLVELGKRQDIVGSRMLVFKQHRLDSSINSTKNPHCLCMFQLSQAVDFKSVYIYIYISILYVYILWYYTDPGTNKYQLDQKLCKFFFRFFSPLWKSVSKL